MINMYNKKLANCSLILGRGQGVGSIHWVGFWLWFWFLGFLGFLRVMKNWGPHAGRIPARFMQIFSIAIHAFSLGILMGRTHTLTMEFFGWRFWPPGDGKFLHFAAWWGGWEGVSAFHFPFSIFQPNKAAMQRQERQKEEEWALSACQLSLRSWRLEEQAMCGWRDSVCALVRHQKPLT